MKMVKFIEILKSCQLEVFYLIYTFGTSLQTNVVTQMIEDKICLNQYGFNLTECAEENSEAKIAVLKEASIIMYYRSAMYSVSSLVTTLFAGTLVNNYPNHLKLIIVVPVFGTCIMVFLLIVHAIFFSLDARLIVLDDLIPWLFGSVGVTYLAASSYIVLTNPPDIQVIKFASCGVANLIGGVAGQYTGAVIFAQKPWFDGQLANYLGIYIPSLVFKLIAALIFLLFAPSVYKLNENQIAKDPNHPNHGLPCKSTDSKGDEKSSVKDFLHKVFSFSAICKLFQTLTKPRESGKRTVLLLLLTIAIVRSMEGSFVKGTRYQFAQRAYGWTNYEFSRYNAIVDFIVSFVQFFGPRLFIYLGISHISIGILTLVSHWVALVIQGSILKTEGYFMATVFNSVYTLFDPVNNSLLGKVVEPGEIGGTFSLISVISSIITLSSNWVLTRIFNATILSYPGFCSHLFAFILVFAIGAFVWIKLKGSHLFETESNEKNGIQLNEQNETMVEKSETPNSLN